MHIKVDKLFKIYESNVILNDISFALDKGQKVGLVGYNGTGKSTLLKIIANLEEKDNGEIIFSKNTKIGYVPQDTSIISEETILEYLSRISEEEILYKIEVILNGLGLNGISVARKINSLSSGQKSKIFLAGVLLQDPDILLLDEPTNNLDLPSLIWFENFLIKSEKTCIIVSHDRLFLDKIVDRIIEIDWQTKKLNITRGKYSDYLIRREKEYKRKLSEYINQKKEIKRLNESAREKKIKAEKGSHYMGTDNDKRIRGYKREKSAKSSKTAKAIEKRIEHIEIVEKPINRDVFRIFIKSTKPKGSRDIILEKLIVGYEFENFKIGPIDNTVSYSSRVLILGLNGSGKSTLLKTITGKIKPLAGKIFIGSSLVVGDLMQEHDNLNRNLTIKQFLIEKTKLPDQEIFSLTNKFGFDAKDIGKKIENLSPGERARVLFALFSALNVNVLILDEPTNHLDLEALEALEEVVKHFTGTIILVSHDRYFLEKFNATHIYEISNSKLILQKDLQSYIQKLEENSRDFLKIS